MTHTWRETAADRGLNLDDATVHATWSELDALAREHGVVGDTYATGERGYAARRAYVEIRGVLHVAPAIYNSTRGSWPAPGAPAPYVHSSERRADEEAGLAENRATRQV